MTTSPLKWQAMTAPDCAAIRAALDNLASPPPWTHEAHPDGDWVHDRDGHSLALCSTEADGSAPTYDPPDAYLISHAPEWLAQLCDALDAEVDLASRLSDDLDNEREFREADQRLMDTWVERAEKAESRVAWLAERNQAREDQSDRLARRAEEAEATIARVEALAASWTTGPVTRAHVYDLRRALEGGEPR